MKKVLTHLIESILFRYGTTIISSFNPTWDSRVSIPFRYGTTGSDSVYEMLANDIVSIPFRYGTTTGKKTLREVAANTLIRQKVSIPFRYGTTRYSQENGGKDMNVSIPFRYGTTIL